MNSAEKQYVVLPKNALEGSGPRNSVRGLLLAAGYDKVANGFDRRDQIEQGDFIFRGVKGADALSTQLELFSKQPLGILMGSDVLAEADIAAMSLGVQSDIQKLVSLNIGECRMRFLVPNESKVETEADLEGRLIFSKYSGLAERSLAGLGVRTPVRQTEGADTRVNDWRKKEPRVGAFEIVGSGDTARQNDLQIVENVIYPTGEMLALPYLDLNRITTDMYASNIQRASMRSRDMLREIGLALESARTVNRFVTFQFNVPDVELSKFADLGMKGPSVSSLLTKDGEPWSAVTISVPENRQNAARAELMARGAKDLLTSSPLNAEPNAETSTVIRLLPFGTGAKADAEPTAVDQGKKQTEEASWLVGLSDKLDKRIQDGDQTSTTVKALGKGPDFCAARYVGEAGELSKAIRKETKTDATMEASQCFYWLIVALKSKGYSLDEVASLLTNDETPTDRLKAVIASADAKRLLVGSGGIGYEAVDYADDAIAFSTVLRKSGKAEALQAAGVSLQKLLSLLKIADIDLSAVMEAERG